MGAGAVTPEPSPEAEADAEASAPTGAPAGGVANKLKHLTKINFITFFNLFFI